MVNIFKVIANLDITEKRKPQDGSFSAEVDDRPVEFRVATAGSVNGEKMVMRILDSSQKMLSLSQLGMRDKMRDQVLSIIKQPHGMFLVVRPDRSRQELDALRLPQRNRPLPAKRHHHREPGRVPPRPRHADRGQR